MQSPVFLIFFLLLCADFEHLVTRPTAAFLLSPVLYVRVNDWHSLQCSMGEGLEARLESLQQAMAIPTTVEGVADVQREGRGLWSPAWFLL